MLKELLVIIMLISIGMHSMPIVTSKMIAPVFMKTVKKVDLKRDLNLWNVLWQIYMQYKAMHLKQPEIIDQLFHIGRPKSRDNTAQSVPNNPNRNTDNRSPQKNYDECVKRPLRQRGNCYCNQNQENVEYEGFHQGFDRPRVFHKDYVNRNVQAGHNDRFSDYFDRGR